LHFDVYYANQNCVDLLIKGKANLNILAEGRSALYFAAREGHPDCVELLIKGKAKMNIYDHKNLGYGFNNCPHTASR
jgi:ankyrin repeat protein